MDFYAPKFRVILHKVSGLKTGDVVLGPLDITGWFGDGSSIQTSKNLRSPCGTFTLSLADKVFMKPTQRGPTAPFNDQPISLYTLIHPMDVIEIIAARDGSNTERVLMRGFVSEVRREETMGNDGKPSRRVTFRGHDFGKVLMTQIMHFLTMYDNSDAAAALTGFAQLEKYFKEFSTTGQAVTAASFLNTFAEITQTYLRNILGSERLFGDAKIKEPYKIAAVSQDLVGTVEVKTFTSTNDVPFWDFLSSNLDVGPLNELYLLDGGSSSFLICKPNFTHYSIYNENLCINDAELISISTSRNDERVANWFWLSIQQSQLLSNATAQQEAKMTGEDCHVTPADLKFYNDKEVYGFRKMEASVKLFPPAYIDQHDQDAATIASNQATYFDWLTKRNKTLRDLNIKNVWYENSVMHILGTSRAQVGETMYLTRGTTKKTEHYVVQVDHNIQPFQSYTTTLHTERGTGALDFDSTLNGNYYRDLNLKGAL